MKNIAGDSGLIAAIFCSARPLTDILWQKSAFLMIQSKLVIFTQLWRKCKFCVLLTLSNKDCQGAKDIYSLLFM